MHRPIVCAVAFFAITFIAAGASAQESAAPLAADAVSPEAAIAEIPIEELRLRIAPLELEEVEGLAGALMHEVRAAASDTSSALIELVRLEREEAQNTEGIDGARQRASDLGARLKQLSNRAAAMLQAIETKGGDIASQRAYLASIAALDPVEITQPVADAPAETSEEVRIQELTARLIASIRDEPPVHERAVPWEVPLAELEVELKPLPRASLEERLEIWRAMLQSQLRQRSRIDILLSDNKKFEEKLAEERAKVAVSGLADVEPAPLKAQLAAQSQQRQLIVSAITDRVNLIASMIKKRGGDPSQTAAYVANTTGQRLNITDPSILQAQVLAWLTSPAGGVEIGLNFLKFLGIVVAFWLLSRALARVVFAAVKRMPRASTMLAPVLSGTVKRVTLIIGFIIGLTMFGLETGPLIAAIGAAGLVIGLALQGTLSNFASGILILINKPYDVGDVINAGGVLGKVEAMNLVSTSVLTFDNQLMLVPNNQIWNGVITNVTGKKTRRVDLTFGISYTADIERAISIINECIHAHDKTLDTPAPVVRVHELADNSVNIVARPWSKTADYWDVYWDLTRAVKHRFDDAGIGIPFPQRDLHVPGAIEVKVVGGELPDVTTRGNRSGERAGA
ncbi:MAG: mechanosensitive ion channel domain-containing protein [Planctomycetota bacterium]